ncbi:MAG: hypothetical protein L6R48_05685 [Planctomycetes bacterium]|nr:hypothetical protein [Planctomycetota bacterium]
MPRTPLDRVPWTLTGWQPYNWERSPATETGLPGQAEIGPLPLPVPGSVQQALLAAGLIPDWRDGLQARGCEWIENRHWVAETVIPAAALAGPGPHRLLLHGVDGAAAVMAGPRVVAQVANTFVPHLIGIEAPAGQPLPVRVVFTDQPRALGQVQRTSRIRDWRSRYPYVWDWSPRLVQVGLWEGVELLSGACLHRLCATTACDEQGLGALELRWDAAAAAPGATVRVSLSAADGSVLATGSAPAAAGILRLERLAVERWWPNGQGPQPLYQLDTVLCAGAGAPLDHDRRPLGFRTVVWSPCRGAPAGARDWVCTVNGRPVFLQGANWVPLRTCFADVTEGEYRERLATYRDLGFNLLRVWGGSVLEREVFYRLCDEFGLMVWQEFPLSSSGIDNHPPDDPGLVADMAAIAGHYISARQHHPALILWCGGNELQRAPDGGPGIGRPCDEREPMLAAQAAVCARLDPGRRYVPTSASGPRFMAEAGEFAQGLHHDVHGPWGWSGDLAGWQAYWAADDALLRSEVGFAGAQGADLTRRHGGALAWPASRDNPYWQVNAGWWIQWEEFQREQPGPADLDRFVAWSQARQAAFLAVAAAASKRRFPACAGFIVWMGHDCFPCPANTAVIDVLGRPKPAAEALARVFRASARADQSIQ